MGKSQLDIDMNCICTLYWIRNGTLKFGEIKTNYECAKHSSTCLFYQSNS